MSEVTADARGAKKSGGTTRRWTAEIRKAQKQGRRAVCSMAPYEGAEVFYSPRHRADPQPWRLAGPLADNGYRFSGRECHTIDPR